MVRFFLLLYGLFGFINILGAQNASGQLDVSALGDEQYRLITTPTLAKNAGDRYQLALTYLLQGNYDLAQVWLKSLETLQAFRPQVAFWRSLIAHVQQDKQNALLTQQALRFTHPLSLALRQAQHTAQPPFSPTDLLLKAVLVAQNNQHSLALEYLEGLLETAPASPYTSLIILAIAQNLHKLGRTEVAISRENSLMLLYPQSEQTVQILYSRSYTSPTELERLLQRYAEKNTSIFIRRRLAELYTQTQNTVALTTLIKNTPHPQERHAFQYNLAMLLLTKSPTEAQTLLEAVAKSPVLALRETATVALVRLYGQQQRQVDALELVNTLLADGSQDLRIKLAQLHLYRHFNFYQEVNTAANTLMNSPLFRQMNANTRAYLFMVRGWAREFLNNGSGALSDYSASLRLTPTGDLGIEANYRISLLYAGRGEAVRAEGYLAALSQTENLTEQQQFALLFAQAHAAYQAGQMPKASALVRELQARGTYYNRSWQTLLAAVFTYEGRYIEAMELYRRISRDQPALKQEALFLSAINAYRAQQFSTAITLFEELTALSSTKTQRSYFFWLGQSYLASNQLQQAANALGIAYSLPPEASGMRPTEEEVLRAYLLTLFNVNKTAGEALLEQVKVHSPALAQEVFYQLADQQLTLGQYKLAGELFEESSKFQESVSLLALYRAGLSYELAGLNAQAKRIYLMIIRQFGQSPEALIVARRGASLLAEPELRALLFGTGAGAIELPTRVKAPLLVSWAQKSPPARQNMVLGVLLALDMDQVDEIERPLIALAIAQSYQQLRRYDEALETYDEVIGLALTQDSYLAARTARAAIFEQMDQLPQAVNEWILLHDTLVHDADAAFNALHQAYELCVRRNLNAQAAFLRNRLRTEYPAQSALKNL